MKLVLCTIIEASISKRSIMFESYYVVKVFDYIPLPNPIKVNRAIGGLIDYTSMYSSMHFQNLRSYQGLFPIHQRQVFHKIFGKIKNLLSIKNLLLN